MYKALANSTCYQYSWQSRQYPIVHIYFKIQVHKTNMVNIESRCHFLCRIEQHLIIRLIIKFNKVQNKFIQHVMLLLRFWSGLPSLLIQDRQVISVCPLPSIYQRRTQYRS